MLAGGEGDGAQLALEIVTEFGEAVGARRLMPITRAHIDSCLYQGQSGLDFADRLVAGKAKVRVPSTLNVGAVDLLHPELNRGDLPSIENGRRLMNAYLAMGCRPTWTCAPYQLPGRPQLGEQVAWAESNAIVFINSVVGARTERYGDFIDICAAITGRVPEHGLHLTENRRAEVVFDIAGLSPQWRSSELFWPLLGFVVGARAGSRIPALVGASPGVDEDSLKAFGAAAASSGAVALFHVVGITPEAPTLEAAVQGQELVDVIDVNATMLKKAQAELTTSGTGNLVAVSVGTPHFSITEFEKLVGLVGGRKRDPRVEFYASTSRDTIRELERRGWHEELKRFGVELVADTCTYLKPIISHASGTVMTNSAKWAYYAPGNLGYEVLLASLADCVASAATGTIVLDASSTGD